MKWFHHAIVPSLILGEIVVLLLPAQTWAWLRAIGSLDPSYVTPEKSTIDWAVATFSFMGLLLALFVPKVSEFDRQLTKEMGVTDAKIKPSTWRCVLFRLYQKEPYSRNWVFDFFLSSQRYFIILCLLGAAFIFFHQLRGLWIILTLIYSYFMLISMESLSNVDQYETLLLNNIQDEEVEPLLDKYVEKVYSTQGHPRQEAFLRTLYQKREKTIYALSPVEDQYFKRLGKIYGQLYVNKIVLDENLCETISMFNSFPFGNRNILFSKISKNTQGTPKFKQWERSFTHSLILLKYNPQLIKHLINDLIPPPNMRGSLDSIGIMFEKHTLDNIPELTQKWSFSLPLPVDKKNPSHPESPELAHSLHEIFVKGMCVSYLSQLLLVLLKTHNIEALKLFFDRLQVCSEKFNILKFSAELFVFVFLALGGTNSCHSFEHDLPRFFQENASPWKRSIGRDFLLLFIFKNWMPWKNWNYIVDDYVLPILQNYPNIRNLFIEKHDYYSYPYFHFVEYQGTDNKLHIITRAKEDVAVYQKIFSEVFGFTDLEELYQQQTLFHDEMRKRFIEKGWSHA
jgi:hypothetical protein